MNSARRGWSAPAGWISAFTGGRWTEAAGAAILMGGLHETISATGDLIGYATGLLLTLLLLALTLRAARLPGTPVANIVFAVSAVMWCAGGMVHAGLVAAESPAQRWAQAVQLTGAGAAPLAILAFWERFAAGDRSKKAARLLRIVAWCGTAAILIPLWWGTIPAVEARRDIAYAATALFAAGALISLRRNSTPRAIYVPSRMIALAAITAAIALSLPRRAWPYGVRSVVYFIGTHLVLLVILCAFFLFARFRYADVFVRYGVRILLSGMWASLLLLAVQSAMLHHVAGQMKSPAAHVVLLLIVANALLLSFTFADERVSRQLIRWMFHSPDYVAERRRFGMRLRGLQSDVEVLRAAEDAAREPLELSEARMAAVAEADAASLPATLYDGEVAEGKDAQLLVPVAPGGRLSHVLTVAPGPSRPSLVMDDLNYLRGIGAQCGHRLEGLQREQETVERESREAVLQREVSEAELRALRAQINPHFLFNALNTVADLIVRDPVRAEAMTLRLASVFRHVLANSSRPLTTIRDEIDFLRAYLHIEEARFGDRLAVEIQVDPLVEGDAVPSLILQPLVENALKHGLGPKPGPGRLWIDVRAEGEQLRLLVEDDGMGPGGASAGVGLSNVAERLRTLYQDRAKVVLEARDGAGTRVTVTIPRGAMA